MAPPSPSSQPPRPLTGLSASLGSLDCSSAPIIAGAWPVLPASSGSRPLQRGGGRVFLHSQLVVSSGSSNDWHTTTVEGPPWYIKPGKWSRQLQEGKRVIFNTSGQRHFVLCRKHKVPNSIYIPSFGAVSQAG